MSTTPLHFEMSAIKSNPSVSWHLILLRIVRPIARFALRHGVKVQDIHRALTQVLIEESREILSGTGASDNVSRICVMTGIHRREVVRQLDTPKSSDDASLLARVIGLWQHSSKFQNPQGGTKSLETGFTDCEFNLLVRAISKELNPATVLFELERTGVVQVANGLATLIKGSYSPSRNFAEGITILSADIDDLISTTEKNLLQESGEKSLHVRTFFDAVRETEVNSLKNWIKKEGHEFHRRIREKISQYDQDINPEIGYTGGKTQIVVTSFSHVVGD